MVFDFLKSITQKRTEVCTRETFYQIVHDPRVTALVKAYRAGQQQAKSQLPAFLFHASFREGRRGNEWAVPSGLYMLDFDHIAPVGGESVATVWDMMLENIRANGESLESLGIMMVHVTPSGKGLRVVAMMKEGHPELTTIAAWQQWLAEAITPRSLLEGAEVGGLDTCVKDLARCSFAVPYSEFLYLDDGIFTKESEAAPASPSATPPAAKHEATSEVTTPLPPQEGAEGGASALYNGTPLSDIATSWILCQGEPRQGERHTCYYQMASYFRYITDNDARLIFDHLPDFGLGTEERWKICDHVVKLSNGGRIPYDFYRFLVDHGYKERPGQQRRDDADHEVDEATTSLTPAPQLPVLPPLVRDLVSVAPVDFKVPTVFALFPILATHCTRIRARYYDGAEHSPSCASVIIAPQGSGKSFVHRFDPLLVHKFEEHDDAEIERLNAYLAEKEEHRNDKKQPKEVRVPLRLLPAKISVTQFLDRQLDAHGLHQLTICDELDTFTKSNDGGSWADKSDVYRVAYDNGTYGQDYKNQTIYKGRVRLHYNWLVTGTPKSVGRFFKDVEDGLVSRVAFCRIENQLFSDFSIWETLSRKQQTQIHRIVDRLDALTYDEEGNIRPTKMVDMSWIFEPLHQWLLGKLQEARKGWNVAMDTYRRRAAVNAFRYAMICTQLYGRLDAHIRQEITEFALWFAEQDLLNRLDLFQQRLNDETPTPTGSATQQQTLFDLLPEKFTKEDVRTLCRNLSIKSEPRYIICIWKKNGDILKLGSGQWMKVG